VFIILIMTELKDPASIVTSLESQVDDILTLYDLAEKAYPYQNIRGERSLNEDEHRRQMVSFSTFGVGSVEVVKGSEKFGFASLYLFSRRGAKHLFDFSRIRNCWVRSLSWFMIG
jgi:hypothetical protein